MNSQLFLSKEHTCPVCRKVFESWHPRSSAFQAKRQHTELFYAQYDGPNPNHYSVVVCPACFFASYSIDFDSVGTFHRDKLKADIDARKQEFNQHDFYGVERDPALVKASYELALRCYTIRVKNQHGRHASLYLRLSWLARETGEPEAERKTMEMAYEQYRQAYSMEELEAPKDEILQTYMLGDLAFRLGLYEEAVRWFQESVRHPSIRQFPELERRIRDRCGDAREAQEKSIKKS
jgi:uncharacterized protein